MQEELVASSFSTKKARSSLRFAHCAFECGMMSKPLHDAACKMHTSAGHVEHLLANTSGVSAKRQCYRPLQLMLFTDATVACFPACDILFNLQAKNPTLKTPSTADQTTLAASIGQFCLHAMAITGLRHLLAAQTLPKAASTPGVLGLSTTLSRFRIQPSTVFDCSVKPAGSSKMLFTSSTDADAHSQQLLRLQEPIGLRSASSTEELERVLPFSYEMGVHRQRSFESRRLHVRYMVSARLCQACMC